MMNPETSLLVTTGRVLAAGVVAELAARHGPQWCRPWAADFARQLSNVAMRPLLPRSDDPRSPIRMQQPDGCWRMVRPL